MKTARALAALATVWLLLGCTSTRQTTGQWVPGFSRAENPTVLIVRIPDGSEREDGVAVGSGVAVTAAVRDALLARGIRVSMSEKLSLADALTEAAQLGLNYVLKGEITEWEDNATAWSSKPDTAALSVELYDVGTKSIAATATHRVASPPGAWTDKSPNRFVPELADHAMAKLFGGAPQVFIQS